MLPSDSANAALAKIQLAHTHRSLKEFEEAEKQARLAQSGQQKKRKQSQSRQKTYMP
jgi:hypothetical protein